MFYWHVLAYVYGSPVDFEAYCIDAQTESQTQFRWRADRETIPKRWLRRRSSDWSPQYFGRVSRTPDMWERFPGTPRFPRLPGHLPKHYIEQNCAFGPRGRGPCRISPGASPYENRRLVRFHCSRASLKRNAHGVEARAPFCSKNSTARRRKHDGTSATGIPTSGGAPKTLVFHRKA